MKKNVIVEMHPTAAVAGAAASSRAFETAATASFEAAAVETDVGAPPSFTLDPAFPPVPMPVLHEADLSDEASTLESRAFLAMHAFEAPDPEAPPATYLVRGEIDEEDIASLQASEGVVQVYSDPTIEPFLVCPGDPAVGTDADVERLLCTGDLHRAGMDGTGVVVAIVDTGINVRHLQSKGKSPNVDAANSWTPRPGLVPGQAPVGHGTMCAYDVMIAAPACILLDIQLLQSSATGPTPMSGVLSDAVRAYRHLVDYMSRPRLPGESRSLVVNNSWGMFHPAWDFPPGDPGNYSDNPGHPFNRIVTELELAGADILFAAGNCGPDCADGRCQGVTTNAIYGANGSASVLCVAGVDITKARVGYSTVGPGRLTHDKPDLSGYTHFLGSGVYPADGGTSAATPVVSGVVAAVRSKRPYNSADSTTHPAAVRGLLTSTCEDLGPAGYDLAHGFGVVNGCALVPRFEPEPPKLPKIDICAVLPRLCSPLPPNICRLIPQLCRIWPVPMPPKLPGPGPDPAPPLSASAFEVQAALGELDSEHLAFVLGMLHGMDPTATLIPSGSGRGRGDDATTKKGCGCGGC
jgi:hypothetical protein